VPLNRRAFLACAAAALAGGHVAAGQPDSPDPSEYEVKAALIYKILGFLYWPDDALPREGEPFRIGVLGEDPFGNILDETVAGTSFNGHSIAVRRADTPEELNACPLIFICAS